MQSFELLRELQNVRDLQLRTLKPQIDSGTAMRIAFYGRFETDSSLPVNYALAGNVSGSRIRTLKGILIAFSAEKLRAARIDSGHIGIAEPETIIVYAVRILEIILKIIVIVIIKLITIVIVFPGFLAP